MLVALLSLVIGMFACMPKAHAILDVSDLLFSTHSPSTDAPPDTQHDRETAQKVVSSGQFKPLTNSTFAHGQWLKITWDKSKVTHESLLMNDFPSQELEDYFLVKNGVVIEAFQSGHRRDFSTRPIIHEKSVIPVLEADYVLYKPCCNPTFPAYFRLLSPAELAADKHIDQLWYVFAYTVIALMFFYNLMIFIYLREKQYLYYCYHLLSITLVHLGWSGLGKQFLWPDITHTQVILLVTTVNSAIASILFMWAFLDTKLMSRRSKQWGTAIIWINLLPLLFFAVSPLWSGASTISNISNQLFVLLSWVVMDYIIIRNIFAGDRTAKIMLVSYVAINLAGITSLLRYNGLIEHSFFAEQAILIAIVFEAVVLSLALAQKIQRLRESNLQAQAEKLRTQQHFARRLLHVQEEEKKELGNALHDGFTHKLLQLKNSIEHKLGKATPESALVVDVLDDIRDLSHVCHPHTLEELGLKAALTEMIARINQRDDLAISFLIDDVAFSDEQNLLLYRTIQASLNNVIQHARANEVLISLQKAANECMQLTITDDGRGFDVDAQTKGLGLKTLHERTNMLSGTLSITSSTDGTRIDVLFPLNLPKEHVE